MSSGIIPVGVVGDVTLTAVWKSSGGGGGLCFVVYDGNGYTCGVVPVDVGSPYVSGSFVVVLGGGDMVRDGYSFVGWALSSVASSPVYVGGG